MTIYYVSDILSNLIEADDVRQLVREQCATILADVPPETAGRLREVLRYFSGKCMGFPAVWLVASALDLSNEQVADRLVRQPGPLYISLTTSIADDFIDREDNVSAAHMMLLYLLVFGALRQPHWLHGEMLDAYRSRIYPLIGAFVADRPLERARTIAELRRSAEESSWRIGNFFETIVRGLTIEDRDEARAAIADLGRSFGNWCSHLDDVVDVERDILAGDTLTYPIFLLSQESPRLADAVRARDLGACLPAISQDWFVDALVQHQHGHIDDLRAKADAHGFAYLADELYGISKRLPGLIPAIRRENAVTVRVAG